jgi:hypothetical protein
MHAIFSLPVSFGPSSDFIWLVFLGLDRGCVLGVCRHPKRHVSDFKDRRTVDNRINRVCHWRSGRYPVP